MICWKHDAPFRMHGITIRKLFDIKFLEKNNFIWDKRCTGFNWKKKNLRFHCYCNFSSLLFSLYHKKKWVCVFLHINCKNSNLTFSWNLYHKNGKKERKSKKNVKKRAKKKLKTNRRLLLTTVSFVTRFFFYHFMKETGNQYFQQTTQFIGNRMQYNIWDDMLMVKQNEYWFSTK